MVYFNFDDDEISVAPIVIYTEYINLHYNKFLKKNFKDITYGDFTYLINILYRNNISQRELSDLLFVSESNVAQIIKRLEKNGYVERTIDQSNKSKKNINLTKKGSLTVLSLLKAVYEKESKFANKYSPEEIDKFKRMLYEYLEDSVEE